MLEFNNTREYKESKKKTLVIAPHNGVEVLGCFGYIDKQCKLGNIVDVVFMEVAEKDIEDLKSCQAFMHVRKSIVFSTERNDLDSFGKKEIVSFLDSVLEEDYDTVFIPSYSWQNTFSTTYSCAIDSIRLKESKHPVKEVLLYEHPYVHNFGEKINGAVYLQMTIDDVGRKNTAFYKYKNEVKKLPSPLNQKGISTFSAMRGLESGLKFAERYYLYNKLISK